MSTGTDYCVSAPIDGIYYRVRVIDRLMLAEIEELLPDRLFDVHVHTWRRAHPGAARVSGRPLADARPVYQYIGGDLVAEFPLWFPGGACSVLLFPLPVAVRRRRRHEPLPGRGAGRASRGSRLLGFKPY